MNQYDVRLTKIHSLHNNLRTDTIEGVTNNLPETGSSFIMFAEGLDFGTRVITTSLVQNVEQIGNEYLFRTLNSAYKLEVLGEANFNNYHKSDNSVCINNRPFGAVSGDRRNQRN